MPALGMNCAVDHAGTERDDADALGRKLVRQSARERVEPGLGCGMVGVERTRAEPCRDRGYDEVRPARPAFGLPLRRPAAPAQRKAEIVFTGNVRTSRSGATSATRAARSTVPALARTASSRGKAVSKASKSGAIAAGSARAACSSAVYAPAAAQWAATASAPARFCP